MRRHWITTCLAILCFATAAANVYTLAVSLLGPALATRAQSQLIWVVLGLFPTPAVIMWPVSLVLSFVSTALISSKPYLEISGAVTTVFSVALGIGILRMRLWARNAYIAICGLTIVAQIYVLFRLVSYSPGLFTVLQSNFRGASAAYIAGSGPGTILASCAISVALLRLLIRNGLPTAGSSTTVVGDVDGKVRETPKAHQFLLIATAAAAFGELFLLLAGLRGSGGDVAAIRILLLVLLAVNVVVIVRGWRGSDRVALGLAAGHGVMVGYIGLLFLPVFLLGLALGGASSNSAEAVGYLLLEIVPMLQVAAAVCAFVMTRALPKPAQSRSIGAWGTAFLIPVVLGTAVPQFYFQWQQGNLPIPGAKSYGDEYHELVKHDNNARGLVQKYGVCAFLYAKLHPESGFPESAALMGPGGTGCLNQEEAAGNPAGYSFHYAATKSDGSTRSDRFTVATQLDNQRQVHGTLMDEKGIPVAVNSQQVQAQPVTADQLSWDTPGIQRGSLTAGTPFVLQRILACATALRGQGDYPATLIEALRVKMRENDATCLNSLQGAQQLMQAAANSNRGVIQAQVLEYQPQRDASGKITHLVMTLRPEHYGVDGVRSYLIDDSGAEHATSEDRAATSDDPAPLPCEAGGACEDAKQ